MVQCVSLCMLVLEDGNSFLYVCKFTYILI